MTERNDVRHHAQPCVAERQGKYNTSDVRQAPTSSTTPPRHAWLGPSRWFFQSAAARFGIVSRCGSKFLG